MTRTAAVIAGNGDPVVATDADGHMTTARMT